MMHDPEKSDVSIVARKPANATGGPGGERVERRGTAKGNADQTAMLRAQDRAGMSQGLERVRQAASDRFRRHHPRWEPGAGKPHAGFCAGGAG